MNLKRFLNPRPAFTIGLLLLAHVVLLAWSATRHAPVVDETGHLPAGLSHWNLRRFDLYCVNPPLVRSVATLPLYLADVRMDFKGYQTLPRYRTEFGIGKRWIKTYPEDFLWWFTMARWACIPFSVLGAWICWKWADDLYGSPGGLTALCLWCFSPTVLGHASLITPDAPAAALGSTACYVYWRWMKRGTIETAVLAGLLLGLTLLTKFTWVCLLGLWPLAWLGFRLTDVRCSRESVAVDEPHVVTNFAPGFRHAACHLVVMYLIALWIINSGYLFEDTLKPLGQYEFFSTALTGQEHGALNGESGNRFTGSWLEHVPVPVPRNVLQGIDWLKFEYERGYPSYLRGVKRDGGWWYYYLYAMLVKMPVGTLALLAMACVSLLHLGCGPVFRRNGFHRAVQIASEGGTANSAERPIGNRQSAVRDELFLLAPAVCVLCLVSSQTGFNHHLRYVLPAFPFLFIFASRVVTKSERRTFKQIGRSMRRIRGLTSPARLPVLCVLASIVSSLSVYPHSLSYFNEPSGGSINGWKHLDFSNIDWGQDLLYAKAWVDAHPDAKPLFVQASGFVSPTDVGIDCQYPARTLLHHSNTAPDSLESAFPPGWYIIGLHRLVDPAQPVHEFLSKEPDDYIGYSMRVYHVP